MESDTAKTSISLVSHFEDLLPPSTDPAKQALRQRLVLHLNSQGEILPAAESPLGRLWNLVNSPTSSLAACEEIILLDPALTSRIFRVANSTAYQAGAATVSEAIRFVGFKCIRELVYNAGVFNQFSNLAVPEGWDIFWIRNIFVARVAERLSSIFFPTNGTEYLVGLIHDVGWLFLAAYAPQEFGQIWNSKISIAEAEREFLPFSHANIGAAIATKSTFPLRAIDAILYHHRLSLIAEAAGAKSNENFMFLAIILGIADQMADATELDLFARSTTTFNQVLASPEVRWLRTYKKPFDLEGMAVQEIEKTQQIYTTFFAKS